MGRKIHTKKKKLSVLLSELTKKGNVILPLASIHFALLFSISYKQYVRREGEGDARDVYLQE